MRWPFAVLLALAALPGGRLASQQPAQKEVTLNEAVERALQVQPAMVQARGDQRSAGAAMRSSLGSYLPTVSASGSSQRIGGTRFNSSTNQTLTLPASTAFNGGLSASLVLFDGFSRLADARSSHASQDAAEAGVVNERFQVTLQTKQAFYNALATEDLVRVAAAQVGISRALYWPTFSVSVGNSYSDSVAPWRSTRGYASGWRVIFSGQWSLFNGFGREKQVTSAVVARDEAQARAADTRRQVSAQLTQQIAALATAFEKISIAETNVAAAAEDLRVQNERYRVGAATILDLLTSQSALTTAEQNLVQVRFDYLIARAQLEAIMGRTL